MIAAVSADEVIWMGRGEVRPLEGGDPDLANATSAFAVVFAYAKSSGGFKKKLEGALARDHLELISLDAAGPLNEMMDIDDHLACALETAETGEPTVFTHYTDEPLDAEDVDAITLRTAAESGEPVQYRVLGEDGFDSGFVIDANETWALVQRIHNGVVAFDGYRAIRIDCLADADIIAAEDDFVLPALERRGERPSDPGVPLDDHRSILAAVSERYQLVSLVDARGNAYEVAIGRIAKVGKDAVTLRGVDTKGAWTGEHKHQYENIEQIWFGRPYEAALASVLPAD